MENKEIWRHSLTFIVVLRPIQYWNKCFICYQDPKLELLADVVSNMTPKLFRVILSCRLAVCPNSECTYPVQSRLICLKISYKKLYFFSGFRCMIQALPIWFWIWFSWWIRGNNEMPLYQWEREKRINQNSTFNNYEIWHKYEIWNRFSS